MKITMPQQMKIVEGLAPAADAAGRSGAVVSLKNCGKCYIVAHITQGNAATIALTPKQSSAVAGTGKKVLANVVPIWADLDTATSDTLARATDAVNYTTDAAVKNKVVIFEINPAQLDTANNFDCISLDTGASNAANITQVLYYLTDLRYAQTTPPTATAD